MENRVREILVRSFGYSDEKADKAMKKFHLDRMMKWSGAIMQQLPPEWIAELIVDFMER